MENKISKEEMKKIRNAIYNTSSNYSAKQSEAAIKNLILKNNTQYFTRKNNARNDIESIGIQKVKKTILREYINLIISSSGKSENPLEEALKSTYNKYKNRPDIDVEGSIEEILKKCLDEDINLFTRDNQARENLDKFSHLKNRKISEIVSDEISKKITNNMIKQYNHDEIENKKTEELYFSNVNINSNNIEMLRSAIISGTRLKREGTISLGKDLQACSSIGNVRKNQEDAVLLVKHPLNPKFKMMVVADGMGGFEQGEEASNKVVTDIQAWFERLSVSYFEDMRGLENNLGQILQKISREIQIKYGGRAGSTFVGAIIGENETLVSNVGDSRAYAVNNMTLQRITEDHSYVEELIKRGRIKNSDDARFHKENNKITQYMGRDVVRPNFYRLQNKDYSSILLLSDGITDLLSDEQLFTITKYTDREKLAQTLVQAALTTNAIKPKHLSGPEYTDYVSAGKDNTTAAVYTTSDNDGIRELEAYFEYSKTPSSPPPPPGSVGLVLNIGENRERQNEQQKEKEGLEY